jgi:hypothetical protein
MHHAHREKIDPEQYLQHPEKAIHGVSSFDNES